MSNNKQFNTVPTIHASRSRFDLSFDHKMSGSVGTLYPCYLQEIYPGDTFSCKAKNNLTQSSFVDKNSTLRFATAKYSVLYFYF